MRVIIVDYGMGNLRSVEKKVNKTGNNVIITNDIAKIKTADKLILPGVGHFRIAVENLHKQHLTDALNETVLIKKRHILGICLGMQLMASQSEEGDCNGLDWFDADVVRFSISNQLKFKVPQMGWNTLKLEKDSPLFRDIPNEAMYYFVHSYYMKCNSKKDILTTTEYEETFT